ncbi:MAG: glycerophosphodiester phosphodiesterase family protein [Bacillota bacterium]
MIKRFFKTMGVLVVIAIIATTFAMLVYNPEYEFIIPEATKFIAHRGHSSEYYENSEQAFLSAAESEFFFAIETDIWLTSDGVWVCAHDANPFEDESVYIHDITYEQAISLPLKPSSNYPQHSTEGLRVVSLQRYLEICYEYDKMAIIELKYTPDKQEIADLIDFVESKIPLERVQFISFHQRNIENIRQENTEIMVQTLSSNLVLVMLLMDAGDNLGINQSIANQSVLQRAKDSEGIINVWTINDVEKARELIEAKVDYITTDYILEI